MTQNFLVWQIMHVMNPDQELYFPHGRIDFLRSMMRWYREAMSDVRCQISDVSTPFTVILQSYKRPWNIKPMVKMMLRFDCVERVIVSNNNELSAFSFQFSDDRVQIINQKKHYPASKFAMIALEETRKGATHFLCIDDDLLLFPDQIARLIRALIHDPSVPHGLVGQRVIENGEWMHHLTGNVPIDILNRVYAFTAEHIHRYAELLHGLGYDSDEAMAMLPFGSDIVLSRSGAAKPRIHDVGRLLDCPTNAKPGIARFKEKDFDAFRRSLWQQLSHL